MNLTEIYRINHGGLLRNRDFRAFSINNGIQWQSVLVNISRWQKQGLLEKVTRGAYLVRDIDVYAPAVACQLLPDGYLSLEYAMVQHGMILDRVYHIDIATPRRVKSFNIRDQKIKVTKIPPSLYWGWEITQTIHGTIRMATPEKALFDRIYLDRTALPAYEYFEDMNLQPDAVDPDRFSEISSHSPKVKRFASCLKEYCNE